MARLRVCTKDKTHTTYGGKFCATCGAPTQILRCPKCNNVLFPDQAFCENCGTGVKDVVPIVEAAVDAPR